MANKLGARRRRMRSTLGDKSCSTSPRWVRGGVGLLLGLVLGGMAGGGAAAAVVYWKASLTDPIDSFRIARTMSLVASGVTVVGGATGLLIGAHKPEC